MGLILCIRIQQTCVNSKYAIVVGGKAMLFKKEIILLLYAVT